MCDVEKLTSLKMHNEEIYTYNIHNVQYIYYLVDFFPLFFNNEIIRILIDYRFKENIILLLIQCYFVPK